MKKATKTLSKLKDKGKISEQQFKILETVSDKMGKNLTKSKRPSVYYRVLNGTDLDVWMVVDKYDDVAEATIYSTQAQIISKFKENDIDFRLIPKHNISEKRIIPKGFKKLIPA